jgi:hypothetical protein
MKTVILAISMMLSSCCSASSEMLTTTLDWLQTWAPQNIEFKVEKSSIKFNGCKQKEYLALVNQPITENIVLEMGVGYAKGRHSWGAFNQKISVKELSFIPRYQISHDLSIGFGLVTQSQTEFRTSQGVEFNFPKNTQWLVSARTDGFEKFHYWEWRASSQKWETSEELGLLFENGLTNNNIELRYTGHF